MRTFSILLCTLCISSFSLEKEPSSFPLGGAITLAVDSFRSLPEGSWNGNMGAFGSLQLAYALPKQQEGIGIQTGYSFGVYDWNGNGFLNSKSLQLQNFISLGLFRMTPRTSGVNAGVVYDWMINDQYGMFGLDPTIEQVRGQFGYLIKGGNELGIQGSYSTNTSHKSYGALPIKFKAINQVNAFWRRIFKNRAETMLWGGVPYGQGLMYESGKAGSYIIGASFKTPLTRSLSIEGHGVYMGAKNAPVDIESRNYAANVCFGITYSFGGCKAGAKPYLSLANNSNFLVDTNTNN